MKPIKPVDTNFTWTGTGETEDLHVVRTAFTPGGEEFWFSMWSPDATELKAIAAGNLVMVITPAALSVPPTMVSVASYRDRVTHPQREE